MRSPMSLCRTMNRPAWCGAGGSSWPSRWSSAPVVLGFSLRRHPGETSFYWLTLVLAAVWTAGAFVSGPLHLGGICWRGRNQRPVITGTTIGLLLGGVFVVGGLIAREIPPVADLITRVLQYAHQGSFLADRADHADQRRRRGSVLSRRALHRAGPASIRCVISTVLYVIATLASGNVMLGFAGIILGTVCAFERRATGGVLAPMLTHFVWGLIMVLGAAADVRRLSYPAATTFRASARNAAA